MCDKPPTNAEQPSPLAELVALTEAITEEFDDAVACHEVWRPAAYDPSVQKRMGQSYAAHAFNIIVSVLRRELFMALSRLWDTDHRNVDLRRVVAYLSNGDLVARLETARVRRRLPVPSGALTPVSEVSRPSVQDSWSHLEARMEAEDVETLRGQIAKVKTIIQSYDKGGHRHVHLKQLMALRHTRLAHRSISPSKKRKRTSTDEDVENFYQDMATLVRALNGAVRNVDYDPAATAEMRRRHADLFWSGVRGENTPGHPAYRGRRQ